MDFRNLYFYLLICVFISLSACTTAVSSPVVAETVLTTRGSDSKDPSPSATPTSGPHRHTIPDASLTLILPQAWQVLGPLEASNGDMPPYEIYILGTKPEASGGPGSSKIVIADSSEWTPELFVQNQCGTCLSHPFEETTLGGMSALRTEIGGGGVPFLVTWYFVENNGRLIALAIHDPETLEPLQDVLGSIQFE